MSEKLRGSNIQSSQWMGHPGGVEEVFVMGVLGGMGWERF